MTEVIDNGGRTAIPEKQRQGRADALRVAKNRAAQCDADVADPELRLFEAESAWECGADRERERIVQWLRDLVDSLSDGASLACMTTRITARRIADVVEAGAHWGEE